MLEKAGEGYASAFEQGNLKHRGLDGREISSQGDPYGSDSEDEDEGDEEDEDEDEEADDQ